jgi:hypothetical protein
MSTLLREESETRMVLEHVSREAWRRDGTSVQFYRLSNGRYEFIPESVELPGLSSDLINRFLDQGVQAGETTWIRAFRSEIQGT